MSGNLSTLLQRERVKDSDLRGSIVSIGSCQVLGSFLSRERLRRTCPSLRNNAATTCLKDKLQQATRDVGGAVEGGIGGSEAEARQV